MIAVTDRAATIENGALPDDALAIGCAAASAERSKDDDEDEPVAAAAAIGFAETVLFANPESDIDVNSAVVGVNAVAVAVEDELASEASTLDGRKDDSGGVATEDGDDEDED